MTLDELEGQLPNGFHDSKLLRLTHDFERATVHLDLNVVVSLNDDRMPRYRAARVTVTGVAFLSLEPPGPGHDTDKPQSLWLVDSGPTSILDPPPSLPPLAPECFSHYFFSSTWNAFFYIAGRSASLEWLEAPPLPVH